MARPIIPVAERRSVHIHIMGAAADVARLDTLRGDLSRSEYVRRLLAAAERAAQQGGGK